MNRLKAGKTISKDSVAYREMATMIEYSKVESVLRKIVLCFPDKIPDDQEELSFNIPAIIIEEAKQVLKEK